MYMYPSYDTSGSEMGLGNGMVAFAFLLYYCNRTLILGGLDILNLDLPPAMPAMPFSLSLSRVGNCRIRREADCRRRLFV